MMISFTSSVLIGLTALSTTLVSNTQSCQVKNEIKLEKNNEITNVEWHNANCTLSDSDKDLFSKYEINEIEASNSMDVFVQEEYVSYDEYVNSNLLNSDLCISTANLDISNSNEYTHNKGYIRFITKAYALGFFDGNIVYHVEVTTEQQKSFILNKKDNLIIRHGDNAVTFNQDKYIANGERYTPCMIYWTYSPNSPTNADEYETLTPNFSCSDAGIYYTFKAGGSTISSDTSTIVYGKTKVSADYYMVATDTTEVQPVYVHNYSLFVDSLSLSFGKIGAGISVKNEYDIMEGSSLTLKGYSSRIKQTVNGLSPNDWGFDARYYFENEGIKSSTIKLNDLDIESKRLRCGYIEEEYINLSPNRIDAHDAYLELTFNKPIYEFSTNLSFWSSSEHLFKTDGDYAYIQYLDSNGDWIILVDLLESDLPTDRKNQKYFEFDFIEGAYGIRFVAHKENPLTNRNNGRICIGETKFVTYSIN